jgi:hypothetical protein
MFIFDKIRALLGVMNIFIDIKKKLVMTSKKVGGIGSET